jgi:hypothetical protein
MIQAKAGRPTTVLVVAMVVAAALASRAMGEEAKPPRWLDTDRPNCQVWAAGSLVEATVTWLGGCGGGKAQGQGKAVWSYRDKEGKQRTAIYDGMMRDGKIDGQGTFTLDTGRYEGQWKNNEMNGHGVLVTTAGARYEGQFKNGKMDGQGVLVSPDGARYEGQFKNGKMDGWGVFLHVDGSR